MTALNTLLEDYFQKCLFSCQTSSTQTSKRWRVYSNIVKWMEINTEQVISVATFLTCI